MRILLFSCVLWACQVQAQKGIRFNHISWAEAKQKAIQQKKPIFIDFYTQWCGPCLLMEEEVFIIDSVSAFYNKNFLPLKVDAEHGEGVELARKYNVGVYPTYIFVDPVTEKMIHQSTSRQDPDIFVYTGQSALDPLKNSVYLTQQQSQGNTSPDFMLNYAAYQASKYNTKEVAVIAEKLITTPGYSMANPKIWNLFTQFVHGRTNTLFTTLLAQKEKYVALYGIEAVDAKLFKEYTYTPDAAELAAAPAFKGKQYLVQKNKADKLIRDKQFEEAATILDGLAANPGAFKKEVCDYLFSTSRYVFQSKISLGDASIPSFWKQKCLGYLQYAVYNSPDRNNVQLHYTYASVLENLLKATPGATQNLPANFAAPVYGEKEYSIRSAKLQKKPVRK